mmetsp:Transcript_6335/g.18550  ORF Transcript_6335/g.18550 Transcript_6335/m.18550 type:complete len:203 (-) Transcript_6335:102-710(-)
MPAATTRSTTQGTISRGGGPACPSPPCPSCFSAASARAAKASTTAARNSSSSKASAGSTKASTPCCRANATPFTSTALRATAATLVPVFIAEATRFSTAIMRCGGDRRSAEAPSSGGRSSTTQSTQPTCDLASSWSPGEVSGTRTPTSAPETASTSRPPVPVQIQRQGSGMGWLPLEASGARTAATGHDGRETGGHCLHAWS